MSRSSNIIFWLKCHRNALNTDFAMSILAISENQGQNFNFWQKQLSPFLVGQNPRTLFSKKKQQIVLSLDFSVSIICGNTKNSYFQVTPLIYFHAPGDGYIIFYNSCPLSDTSIVCEKRKYNQSNFFININNILFYIHLSCDLQIWRSILKSLSSVCFILSHIPLVLMASKE